MTTLCPQPRRRRARRPHTFQDHPMDTAVVSYLPPSSPPRRPAAALLRGMADALAAEPYPTAPLEAEEAHALASVLAREDVGAFAGALSLLTSFVHTDGPQAFQRQVELTRWFRCLAKSALDRGESFMVRADDRCLRMWALAAETVRQRAIVAVAAGTPDAADLAARAALYRAEVVALRDHLGVVDEDEV